MTGRARASRLVRLAEAHGVRTSYEPRPGLTLHTSDETVVEVLAALGVDASTPEAVRSALETHRATVADRLLPPTVVLRAGRPAALPAAARLPEGTALRVETEDGGPRDWGEDLPVGVHALRAHAPDGRGAHATLIVAPERLPAPPVRGFGLLVQLYSLLSARSWGMGDLGDLAQLAAWAGRTAGASFIQLNPLHQAVPTAPGESGDPSPYRPSSRRFPDPIHLRVEDLPEYRALRGADRERVAALAARAAELRDFALRPDGRVDRDAVWAVKRAALEALHRVPADDARRAEYQRYAAAGGRPLEDHATWHALAELYGSNWRDWPPGLDDPRSERTARARLEHRRRVDFHRWLAWLTDTQLAHAQHTARQAGMSVGLVQDLAVGVHPSGADTWAQQDVFAEGMSIGAPPDAFNSAGQDWGLPPWRPDALAACGHEPYRQLLRAQLRHGGALRVDHVMGLFRQWWVPHGRPPTDGTYVRYDADAMLGLLTLEAARAGASVVGEDLGTVEDGVREELADRGVLGTSVLWFERDWGTAGRPGTREPLPPEHWRPGALATLTTHDLPSTAARLRGEHVELHHALGLLPAERLADERAAEARSVADWLSLCARLGIGPDGFDAPGRAGHGDEEAARIAALYRLLARGPAAFVGVWLPDGLGDRRPQNVPGTSGEYPNWRLPIADGAGRPVPLEELTASPRLRDLLAAVRAELVRPTPRGVGRTCPDPADPITPAGPIGPAVPEAGVSRVSQE
ncbi:4-alpha-glucanotransferase [Streptomyces sp. OF3]|uniref:4-alpha-glucanotransferase n=1 Tax=Streptomyces alkaliterrae TaxID=2213162 RepID=A0A7W3ZM88_9ACTN|nr:4-alpha-glucanotransferase [Streptomyces alkaliterrae]MBB1253092.1 4-alpha-glucanotransferase [Streptomyces alkaliterrae]